MRAKDVIDYELENANTIMLHVNKSVCRAYEVSAYRLMSYFGNEMKVHHKNCQSQDVDLLYVWFPTNRISDLLDRLYDDGYELVSEKDKGRIILKKEAIGAENYDGWKDKMLNRIVVEMSTIGPMAYTV